MSSKKSQVSKQQQQKSKSVSSSKASKGKCSKVSSSKVSASKTTEKSSKKAPKKKPNDVIKFEATAKSEAEQSFSAPKSKAAPTKSEAETPKSSIPAGKSAVSASKKEEGKEKKSEKTDSSSPPEKAKLIDPKNTAPPPKDATERTAKVSKNEEAIRAIIEKLRAIPLDNIAEETKNDLIRIHAITRGIVLRYVQYRVDKEKAKLADILEKVDRAEEEAKAATSEQKKEMAKQGDGVLPSFEDIQWPEVVAGGGWGGKGVKKVEEAESTVVSKNNKIASKMVEKEMGSVAEILSNADSVKESGSSGKDKEPKSKAVPKSKLQVSSAKSKLDSKSSAAAAAAAKSGSAIEKSCSGKSTAGKSASKKSCSAGKKQKQSSQPGTIKLEAKKITLN
ncbi:hypothetical protein TYRP_001015 [Tyrophagus putrescentiae]|nr:hypothetical protein TYRP_001015 [Tyrophagus putrescentiae]